MISFYHIGLDIHKKTIAYCIKTIDGSIVQQGAIQANRKALYEWVESI